MVELRSLPTKAKPKGKLDGTWDPDNNIIVIRDNHLHVDRIYHLHSDGSYEVEEVPVAA